MDNSKKEALILLGCPQVPVQTSLAIYVANALRKNGVEPVITGTPAAANLVKVADPEQHYAGNYVNLDRTIADIAEDRRDFDLCFVFIHNDAGISYAATMSSISEADMYAIVFGEHAENLAAEIEFPAKLIVSPAKHNPMPLRRKIDEVI